MRGDPTGTSGDGLPPKVLVAAASYLIGRLLRSLKCRAILWPRKSRRFARGFKPLTSAVRFAALSQLSHSPIVGQFSVENKHAPLG